MNEWIIHCFDRTCRLRKKAQHEANKLKLQGLNEEHSQSFSRLIIITCMFWYFLESLIEIIASIKLLILQRFNDKQQSPCSSSFESMLDRLIATKYRKTIVYSSINRLPFLYFSI